LKKALEKGYVVQRIYEVWNFDETEHYDPKTKTGGLFTDYVNTFLKMKQEASGWQQSKQQFVFHFFTGNTGMYSPLGGRILHLISPSYCCISVKPSVTISGCTPVIFPVILIYGYGNDNWKVKCISTLESGNASSTEKFEKTTLRNCVQQSEMINPLEPRDAFYGGRTEAFTLFQKDQDISYVDVTSLYPYINKTGKIPIGQPEIVTASMIFVRRYVDTVSVAGFHYMFYTE
jgi:hypothetical protein